MAFPGHSVLDSELEGVIHGPRKSGKVRKILICPGNFQQCVVAAHDISAQGPISSLILYDTASGNHIQTVILQNEVLNVIWQIHDSGNQYLVALCKDGSLSIHPFRQFSSEPIQSQINLPATAYPSAPPKLVYGFGSLACTGSNVAFSLGSDIGILNVEQGHEAFISGAKIIVEYDSETKERTRSITIQHNPCSLAVARTGNLIVVHDATTGAYFYSSVNLTPCDVPPVLGARDRNRPVPLCFAGSQYAIVGDGATLRVLDIQWNRMQQLLPQAKPYQQVAADQRLLVVAAFMPDDEVNGQDMESGGWQIQRWESSPAGVVEPRLPSPTEAPQTLVSPDIDMAQADPIPDKEANSESIFPNPQAQLDQHMKDSVLDPNVDAGQDSFGTKLNISEIANNMIFNQNASNDPMLTKSKGLGGRENLTVAVAGQKRREDTPGTEASSSNPKRLKEDPFAGFTIQSSTCPNYGAPSCLGCLRRREEPSNEDTESTACRFINFRWMKDNLSGGPSVKFRSLASEQPETYEYHPWTPPRTEEHKNMIKITRTSVNSIGFFAHLFSVDYSKSFDINNPPRNRAHYCDMGVFFNSWFCEGCGLDVCHHCYENLHHESATTKRSTLCGSNAEHSFIPMSSFTLGELEKTVGEMKLSAVRAPQLPSLASPGRAMVQVIKFNAKAYGMTVERIPIEELTEDYFAESWAKCKPFIIGDVFRPEAPEALLDLNDTNPHTCAVQYWDGKAWVPDDSTRTLEAYFRKKNQGSKRLQVKDYPPNKNLQEVHPNLYEQFQLALDRICKAHTGPNGPLNLFSYIPKGGLPPDLGPKLYISQADHHDEHKRKGTTFVHMDKSGAINIMLYSRATGRKGQQVEGARWNIWPKSQIEVLSQALDPNATPDSCRTGQPIVAEEHFVSNLGNSLKMAFDFVSPSQIHILRDLEETFRHMNSENNKSVENLLIGASMESFTDANGVHFTTRFKAERNSNVLFHHHGVIRAGQIERIDIRQTEVYFTINLLKDLLPKEQASNTYQRQFDACRWLLCEKELSSDTVEIGFHDIIGHFASCVVELPGLKGLKRVVYSVQKDDYTMQ
ncbi:Lysine-specific demethylase 3B [Hypsizygus marmoreus]|uniref:Lysine-specific demethylase 3B n=1 Tax=Hypsizygus marmoreus TaxID=39966 RepID=A0A369JLN1_HYPMA|nr:Lysine-specific demethylase 3B [Hypsizygus marmoreus]